jgi:hypothetical protein
MRFLFPCDSYAVLKPGIQQTPPSLIPHTLSPHVTLYVLDKNERTHPGCIVSSVIGIEEVPERYKRIDKHRVTNVMVRFQWQDEEWTVNGGRATEMGPHGCWFEDSNTKSSEDGEAQT